MDQFSSRNRRVLYIEDNVANRKLMSSIVKKLPNVDLVVSENARDGIEKARALSPDTILLDILLPDMSGLEVLPILRALPNLQDKQTQIIALTASALKEDVASGLKMGFDDYLTKPFEVEEIMALLSKTGAP